MIGSGPQNGFRVQKRNINTIRLIARNVSDVLGIENPSQINFGTFLDELSVFRSINYVILESHEMAEHVEAYCIPEEFLICIRNDVYERACLNYPRDKFTIMHELGHLLLGHRRTANRETEGLALKMIEDSEWQANQFAGEILMPYHQIKMHNLKDEYDIQNHFDVSYQAAFTRYSQLNRRGEM